MIFPTFLAFLRCLRSLYQPPVLAVTEATQPSEMNTFKLLLRLLFLGFVLFVYEGHSLKEFSLVNSFIDGRQRWDRTGAYSLQPTHL